jgi:nucleoredoxin
MPALTDLFGDTLATSDGSTISTTDALSGKKAVGIYFSAHWCGPCRGFTPKLAEWYKKDLKALNFEIIFVSSDRDEDSFKSYHGEQPWLAVPFARRDVKNALSKKYKVQGIPSFVIIDGETGETITTDGRGAVSEDPTGKAFPWKPPTFFEAVGSEFLTGTEGDTVSLADIQEESKYIGLYFSAHWCPPCKTFTPELVKAYNNHLKAKGLEIIFVSSDRDQRQFLEYFTEMPWKAIPMGDKRKDKLSKRYDVEGIPSFVIVDAKTGETITTEARGSVGADPEGAEFPWYPKALNNMSAGEGLSSINEESALCVLLDECSEDERKAAKAVLEPIAEAHKASGTAIVFFYAPENVGPVGQVRKLTKLASGTGKPQMVLLDIPDEGGYYVSDVDAITADTVESFIGAFKSKGLERKQLG